MLPIKLSRTAFEMLNNAEHRQAVHVWRSSGEIANFFTKPLDLQDQVSHEVLSAIVEILPEVKAKIPTNSAAAESVSIRLDLDQGRTQGFVALVIPNPAEGAGYVLIWPCPNKQPDTGGHPSPLDGKGCLSLLGVLAANSQRDVKLQFIEQEDKAFMWKASSVHPLQMLENAYQRVVQKAGKQSDDPIAAQSETLSRFFMQDAGSPECVGNRPMPADVGEPLSAVKMNHLIDSFYLFRLLIQYRAEANVAIDENLRAALSSNLTKLLHNGNRAKMGWVSDWLTDKISELAQCINALNRPKRRVIFFLKGGRALNYYLGTPQNGENDWDTQVVIDPNLPAEEWYQCLAEVHDTLLLTLKRFKAEFTALVEQNAVTFADYLKDNAAPTTGDDEEIDENEASDDASSLGEHANCKAELIDIGIPRRDSASALEEWTRLSAEHALLAADNGVIYPHREYYLNEYLMMVRDAFLPNSDVGKAPKRITRFGLILASPGAAPQVTTARLAALPQTQQAITDMHDAARRELYGIMIAGLVEAYNLVQDKGLAGQLDPLWLAQIRQPPALPKALADLLTQEQLPLATDVAVAHAISRTMDAHWTDRDAFFEERHLFFDGFVRDLAERTRDALREIGSQFGIAGSYAARLHAKQLRLNPDGLEPIRRLLIKMHCAAGSDRVALLERVRVSIMDAASAAGQLRVEEGTKQSLLLYLAEPVKIGMLTYAPLVMKIRVVEQTGNQLPVLTAIDGLPVLDLRYLVADYRKKTSKIDERGARRVLAAATAATSAMLSHFDFHSDKD